MVRSALACGLCGFVLSAGLALAQDQGPPLDPPSLVPPAQAPAPTQAPAPATGPASATPPRAAAPGVEQNRSLLVIPGVTAPVPSRSGTRPARTPSPAVILDAPSSPSPLSPGNPTSTRAAVQPGGRAPAPRVQLPLTLEAIPDDAPSEPGSEDLPAGRSGTPRSPRSNSPRSISEDPSPAPASSASRPAQSRGSTTVFGRFLGPMASTGGAAGPSSSITVEPRSDPAADAAVKRRIEKQVQQALGDRVRSVEVRVNGRTVVFRAQAARFWQRRGVRRSLETLPLPSGYRGRVEMVD